MLPRKENSIRCRKKRKKSILLLTIVQHLNFIGCIFRMFLVRIGIVSLSTNGGVSDGNGACHGECIVGGVDDVGTNLHHGDICCEKLIEVL